MRLPQMRLGEQVVEDYRSLSLSLKAHPLSFLRAFLARERVTPNEALAQVPSGRRITVAGLVLVRQRPGSAKGVIFMTLEDEGHVANVIVWPKMFETCRAIVIGSRLVKVTGKLQSESGVIHIVAEHIEDITARLSALTAGTFGDHGLANADEVRRPVMDMRNKPKPRERMAAILNSAKPHGPPPQREPPRTSSPKAVVVMPKGRNFR